MIVELSDANTLTYLRYIYEVFLNGLLNLFWYRNRDGTYWGWFYGVADKSWNKYLYEEYFKKSIQKLYMALYFHRLVFEYKVRLN